MKRLLILLALIATLTLAGDKDYFILGVNITSSAADIATAEAMIRANIDPDYVTTNCVKFLKNDNPKKTYYIACWDVEGRGFPFTADNATAWVNSHGWDNPSDIVVLKKFDDKWSPEE